MSNLSPHVGGSTRFAVILLCFNDLPPLSISASVFKDFIAGVGKGGVSDYWKDISYGTIDLTGSEVYGPYNMQYSYVQGGNQGRGVWISEAHRLAKENGVDLSGFYGVIAVVNSNPDDSNDGGKNLALGISQWGQNNWRWCKKCQGLAYAGSSSPGPCPATGTHDTSESYDYTLAMEMPDFSGQNNWRWCRKCQGLAFGGNTSRGFCPAGGSHEFSDSANYTLAFGSVNFQGQSNWQWCKKCEGLAFAGNSSPGACPAGGTHQHDGSGNYTLAAPVYDWYYKSHLNVSFAAHEMGHCFDLQHAHCAGVDPPAPNWDYCDPWDVMGPGTGVFSSEKVPFSPVGPGLNAGNLARLGWIPDDRIYTAKPSSETIQLAALNQPAAAGFLMARIVTPDRIYTVEYRQRNRWDRGLAKNSVVIHETRTPYTLGQNNWRWCNRCMGLAYAGFGPGSCPAGGLHNHGGSRDYSLMSGVSGFSGQNNWKYCYKCQGLAYAGFGSGHCPAGGTHDQTRSFDYTLIMDATTFAGQSNWRWCQKCQGLAYRGAAPGPCPSGGQHDLSRSADYTLLHFVTGEPFLLGDWQAAGRWINFERGVTVLVDSIDTVAATATISIQGA